MNRISLTRPAAGHSSVVSAKEASGFVFDFSLDQVSVERSGDGLSLNFDQGGRILIEDFFQADSLDIVFEDGSRAEASAFLASLGDDALAEPAADAPQAGSGGSGEYRADGGDLLDGVDRLGAADGLNQWGGHLRAGEFGGGIALAEAGPGDPGSSGQTEVPGQPGPLPQPRFFLMIGHSGPLDGQIANTRIMPLNHAPDRASALAGQAAEGQQVDTSGWGKWHDWTTDGDGQDYQFSSRFGSTMLYNPETRYFGYFPEDGGLISGALADPGYYYDFFTYTVIEDGAPVTKYGHILYINDGVFPSVEDFFRNFDAESLFRDQIARQEGYDLSAAAEDLRQAREHYAEILANQGEGGYTEEDLQYAREWLEYVENWLEELNDTIDGLWKDFQSGQQDLLDEINAALKDLGQAVGNPGLAAGTDSICAGHDQGLEIAPGQEPPLIDREFDKAGFESFLEQNNYITEAGPLRNVSVSGTAGSDVMDLGYLSLGEGSGIDLSAGDDSLVVRDASGSVVKTGSGDDTLHFAGAGREYTETVLRESDVFLGQGDDALIVDGDVQESRIYTDRDSAGGPEYAGNDSVTVNGGLIHSDIFTGGGNDDIVITGAVSGDYDWMEGYAPRNVIDTGSGNDSLTIKGGTSYINIDMGEGDDSLVIENAAYNSNINMGSGNDTAMIRGGAYESSVNMGDGDDALHFDLTVGDSWWSPSEGVSAVRLDGGGGTDVLAFSCSDETVDWGQFFSNGSTFNENTSVGNFEILHLDLSNGRSEEINLDFLVDQVKGLQTEGRFSSIVITGDGEDRAWLDSGTWGSGEAVSGAPGGIEGDFTHFSATIDGQEMHLYIAIQQAIASAT